MSLKSNELLRTIQKNTNDNDSNIRLAMAITTVSGRYKVQFYGESEPSQKTYMKLRDVTVRFNTPIMMQKINGTYVIIGNVE